MIGRLTGSIVNEDIDGTLVLDVQGVGYEVSTPPGTGGRLRALWPQGPSTLHVHTHVREDTLQLFGFATPEDRVLFRTLLGVGGIGPKTSLAIIAAMPAAELARAVQRREIGRLTAVPGVGKKTAERLMLELRDKLSGASFSAGSAPAVSSGAGASAGGTAAGPPARELLFGALTRMGFKGPDVDRVIDEFGARVGQEPLGDLVRESLQRLTK
ncbi:MAG TPA: Holliday junction branch migration protein RuvA [Polyangiaceae bacterium]|nr:Holliday junction branch migration protein RuvA [Polyangiaceae bacterium]